MQIFGNNFYCFDHQHGCHVTLLLGPSVSQPRDNNSEFTQQDGRKKSRGGSRIFLGGGALISCSTSTPINHIVFFLQNTSCIRKPQVISGGGGVHPLHPAPRSAPAIPIKILWNLISNAPILKQWKCDSNSQGQFLKEEGEGEFQCASLILAHPNYSSPFHFLF